MVMWAGTQTGALIGLIFSLYFIREVEIQIDLAQQRAALAPVEQAIEETPETEEGATGPEPEAETSSLTEAARKGDIDALVDGIDAWGEEVEAKIRAGVEDADAYMGEVPPGMLQADRGDIHQLIHNLAPHWLRQLATRVNEDGLFWIKFGETVGLIAFGIQFLWTLFAVRIDYAQRWYMVTDRSLRLRWGVVRIQESTMSFANLQQVAVKQGPLQRLLKIADVEVRSAGGGSSESEKGTDDSMHRSVFHAVENATEIRDLILMRLKRYRQAGLGEPDDVNDGTPEGVTGAVPGDTLAAARELLTEAKALRREVGG
jgi:membrane protein YdbS with pleckstrin-like domain